MININVFSNEKAWSKRLKKKELFFSKICKAFPKKYKFLNKKVYFSFILITPIIERLNNIKTGNHTDKINGNLLFSPKRFEKWPM